MELKELVIKWLKEENLYCEELKDDTAIAHYAIRTPHNHNLEVILPKSKNDCVIIATHISIVGDQYNAFMNMSEQDRIAAIDEICSSVLFIVQDITVKPELTNPQIIELANGLFHDGLNKNMFIREIINLDRCVSYLVTRAYQQLGNHTISTDDTDYEKMYG